MSVLTLRLASPLQSWGSSSRFTRRATESAPTKSGILGLLAAAQGRRRSDSIEDLLVLALAVRVDQPGVILRDFHTAHHQTTGAAMPLTDRFYWSDAVFVAFIGGPRPVLDGLHEALRDPCFPLYFGRRSCVPSGRISRGVDEVEVEDALKNCPWLAGRSGHRKHSRASTVRLAVRADQGVLSSVDDPSREFADVPVSWNPEHRQYRTRMVVDSHVTIPTGFEAADVSAVRHDPMATLGGL